VFADAKAHLGEQAVDANFFDEAGQPVPCAEASKRLVFATGGRAGRLVGIAVGEQPVDFRAGDPVVAALGGAPTRADPETWVLPDGGTVPGYTLTWSHRTRNGV
jgi:hypothetical protein